MSHHQEDNKTSLNESSERLSANGRRKQYKFQSSRSQSAPARKKKWWLQRGENLFGFGKNHQGTMRRIGGSQQSILTDRMVSRRLISVIAAWHDIHANLLKLTLTKSRERHHQLIQNEEQCHQDLPPRCFSALPSTSTRSNCRLRRGFSDNSTRSSSPCSCASLRGASSNSSNDVTEANSPLSSSNNTSILTPDSLTKSITTITTNDIDREASNSTTSKPIPITLAYDSFGTVANSVPSISGNFSQTSNLEFIIKNINVDFRHSLPPNQILQQQGNNTLDLPKSQHQLRLLNPSFYNNKCSNTNQNVPLIQRILNDKYRNDNESNLELIIDNNEIGNVESGSNEEDDESLISDDILDEIVENEQKQYNKFSLSNPELTSAQIKTMFPELSDHWSF